MSIVRVKTKFQVTIPRVVREQAGVTVGDLLEAKVEKGKITLTPKGVIEKRIAQSLAEFREGKSFGPFDTAEEMLASLHSKAKKLTASRRKRAHR